MPEQADESHLTDLGKYVQQISKIKEIDRDRIPEYEFYTNRSIVIIATGQEPPTRTPKGKINAQAMNICATTRCTSLHQTTEDAFHAEAGKRSPLEIFVGAYDGTMLPSITAPAILYMFKETRPSQQNAARTITHLYFTATSPDKYDTKGQLDLFAEPSPQSTLGQQVRKHIDALTMQYGDRAVVKQYIEAKPPQAPQPAPLRTQRARRQFTPGEDARLNQLPRGDRD